MIIGKARSLLAVLAGLCKLFYHPQDISTLCLPFIQLSDADEYIIRYYSIRGQ